MPCDQTRPSVRQLGNALATPFCTLWRFAKDVPDPGPRVLVVAPMSGHFATRLRGTLDLLLPKHDVHVTDWADARGVPLAAGPSAWTTWSRT